MAWEAWGRAEMGVRRSKEGGEGEIRFEVRAKH
jgi:hypothetical protein